MIFNWFNFRSSFSSVVRLCVFFYCCQADSNKCFLSSLCALLFTTQIINVILQMATFLILPNTLYVLLNKFSAKYISSLSKGKALYTLQHCLTISWHAQCQTFLQSAILTSISIYSVDDTVFISWTLVVHWAWLWPSKETLHTDSICSTDYSQLDVKKRTDITFLMQALKFMKVLLCFLYM